MTIDVIPDLCNHHEMTAHAQEREKKKKEKEAKRRLDPLLFASGPVCLPTAPSRQPHKNFLKLVAASDYV